MPGMGLEMYFGTVSPDWLLSWGDTKEKDPAPQYNGKLVKYFPPSKLDDSSWYEVEAIMFAVLHAKDRFVMLEIGAGYGRWLTHAHWLLRSRSSPRDVAATYVGVEADPYHFSEMKMNLAANGIPEHEVLLLQGAVTDKAPGGSGQLNFMSGDPDKWWGASIGGNLPVTPFLFRHLLSPFWTIDHIDFDCQECEINVITDEIMPVLSKKVKSMWIECHSLHIGETLATRFINWGWVIVYEITPTAVDFGYGSIASDNELTIYLWVLNPNFYPNGKGNL